MSTNKFKEFFDFNSTERRGSIVLIILSFTILLIPSVYSRFYRPDIEDITAFSKDILAFEEGLRNDTLKHVAFENDSFSGLSNNKQEITVIPFPFNPNGLSNEDWRKLGLKDWQIKVIKNYEAKGGRFYKKEDLKKIYGIDGNLYMKLEPFITIPQSQITRNEPPNTSRSMASKQLLIDINEADTNMLMELRGIGPAFARRIVKYREKLGGFYSVDQLLEVYGFDPQRLGLIKEQCTVGKGPYRMIRINTVSAQEIKYHPYLSYDLAKKFIDARIQKGGFRSAQDIKGVPEISDELLQKVIPYFDFQN
jgi:competence protein ComEA